MPLPNITNKNDWFNELLIRCICHSHHFLSIFFDPDEKYKENLSITFLDEPRSIFGLLKDWFKKGRCWWSEIELSHEDAIALRDKCNEYINYCEKYEKQKIKSSV